MANEYRILRTWDDEKADWTYSLQINNGEGAGWEATVYNGDGDWATRESEHYKAPIVDDESTE